MSKSRAIPHQQLTDAWQDILTRGFQMFAYFDWWQLIVLNPSLATGDRRITLRNATLESSLMSIRDLDDFFLSSSRARSDDMIASDYGFPAGRHFLKQRERMAINKKLAHLTYQSTIELQQDPLKRNPRTWNNAEMVNRAANRLLEFLDHLESSFFAGDATKADVIGAARKTICMALKNINAIARAELDFPA